MARSKPMASPEITSTPYILEAWPPELRRHLDKLHEYLRDWAGEATSKGLHCSCEKLVVNTSYVKLTLEVK